MEGKEEVQKLKGDCNQLIDRIKGLQEAATKLDAEIVRLECQRDQAVQSLGNKKTAPPDPEEIAQTKAENSCLAKLPLSVEDPEPPEKQRAKEAAEPSRMEDSPLKEQIRLRHQQKEMIVVYEKTKSAETAAYLLKTMLWIGSFILLTIVVLLLLYYGSQGGVLHVAMEPI